MPAPLILASGSEIRAQLLSKSNVGYEIIKARVDEDMIRRSLQAEGASPRDVADALAEAKARKVSLKHPEALVLGCDQVLDFQGTIFSKPASVEDARNQLLLLRGNRHMLLSAAVIYQGGEPLWRHVGVVRLQMRQFSNDFLEDYLTRNFDSIRHSVGGYKLEEEGVRLFDKIEGDYFTVLGMPLLEILSYLTLRGDLPT
ncbi:Maf family protein [Shimia marina]|uniref:Nucleoside triphosphate pyrophosphatase n=1 Tax=Shimia marina TaxID=321267 RepID=A0A0P1EM26_9RHOB|nr:Maf family protein [Shimia marina]CUH51466.1 Maf-like protein YceF [Shimia marina]SFD48376.1 septum formation protein [Shimia marina]